MVDQESLQNYADEVFAGLALEAPKAERNKGNGKFRLVVPPSEGVRGGAIELDENTLHADMKTQVRELRDLLFPPKPAPEVEEDPVIESEVVDAPVELAALAEPEPVAPEPAVAPDPLPTEETRPDVPAPNADQSTR